MRVALRIFTVCMLVLALGLHWALLQTVAWTGMIINYTHNASLHDAFTKTFDGQHPCRLCKIIKNSRSGKQEQEPQQVEPEFALDLGLVWQATTFEFRSVPDRIPVGESFVITRVTQPPKPRPRDAFIINCG